MKKSKLFGHLSTVRRHRRWVRYFCFKMGMYKRGLLHDLSKYSPAEFWESVRYWQGNRSPIDASKNDNGYSPAWQHHKGRNKHHYEYWCDRLDNGTVMLPMPYDDMMEMIADYLAAAAAYHHITRKHQLNAGFFENEYSWWQVKKAHCAMNEVTKDWVEYYFSKLLNFKKNPNKFFKTFRRWGHYADKASYERERREELQRIKEKFAPI